MKSCLILKIVNVLYHGTDILLSSVRFKSNYRVVSLGTGILFLRNQKKQMLIAVHLKPAQFQ